VNAIEIFHDIVYTGDIFVTDNENITYVSKIASTLYLLSMCIMLLVSLYCK
jgi:hypothetical protein